MEIDVVHAMTMNETSSSRDQQPFDALRDAVPPAPRNAKRTLNIWCAASATGREP